MLATGDGAVHEVGTRASVQRCSRCSTTGRMNVVVEGGERFRLLELTSGRLVHDRHVEPVRRRRRARRRRRRRARAPSSSRSSQTSAESDVDLPDADSPQFEFELAARVDFGVEPKQELLASTSPRARVKRLDELLEIALEAVRLEHTLRERAGQNGKVTPLETDLYELARQTTTPSPPRRGSPAAASAPSGSTSTAFAPPKKRLRRRQRTTS